MRHTYAENVAMINQLCIRRMAASIKRNLCDATKELSYTSTREDREKRKEEPMFGYVSKIASKLRGPSIQDREMTYLNGSTDRVDLEYRQRQIDRGLFRNRPFNML